MERCESTLLYPGEWESSGESGSGVMQMARECERPSIVYQGLDRGCLPSRQLVGWRRGMGNGLLEAAELNNE